ncbi:terpene synthase metal-binding domain-containing protein [Saprospira grandis str. Lewin]|uniref:Terpene synthase n=2 Tax=Saprospira TaxID=1007 RepID=H6L0C9_SAPGL|nr:terpene synthase metal-binding domain-containing protein [Saprospira grandis str. Lewin]
MYSFPPLYSNSLKMSLKAYALFPQRAKLLIGAADLAQKLGIKTSAYSSHHDFIPDLYPKASYQRLLDVTIFFNTLYYFDNIFGEDCFADSGLKNKPELNQFLQLWKTADWKESPIIEVNNFAQGLLQFRERLLRHSTTDFFYRFSENLYLHLKEALCPKGQDDLQEYIISRRWTSGMDVTLDLYEYTHNSYLSASLLSNAKIQRLKYLVNIHAALSNDLFSYPAEEGSVFNLVAVLSTKLLSKEKALEEAVQLVNSFEEEFSVLYARKKEILAELPLVDYGQAEEYIDWLAHAMGASYIWQVNTNRYKHPQHYFEDMRL